VGVRCEDLGFIPEEECTLERSVLRDPVLEAQLRRRGYVVVPFLEPGEVDSLRHEYATAATSAEGINPPGAYNDTFAEFSVIHSRPDFRRHTLEMTTQVFERHTDHHLLDYRPLFANFVNKPPGTGVVPAHQNFSVVDESRFRSISVWVALVDCTTDNGAMWMLDGSHARLRGRRGMWSYQTFGEIESALVDELLTPLEVEAGHAVILDDALVHYSPPNHSTEQRLAIQYVTVPREADSIWFQQVGARDGVIDFWHGDGDERYGERIDRIEIPTPRLDLETFRHLLGST
jgi:hypothetical protein